MTMMWHGGFGWFGWFGWVFMVAWWLLVAAGILWLVRALGQGDRDASQARRILDSVRNTDTVVHTFTVPSLGVSVTVQPGSAATVGLRPGGPGTYGFFCAIAGHAQAGMRGSLVVTA